MNVWGLSQGCKIGLTFKNQLLLFKNFKRKTMIMSTEAKTVGKMQCLFLNFLKKTSESRNRRTSSD